MGTCKVFFNINPSLLVSFLSKPIAFQSVRRIRCCALFIPRNSYLSIFPYQRRKACGTIWDAGWSAMQLFQLRCNEQQKSWKSTSTFSRGRDGKNKPRQGDDDDEEELSLDLSNLDPSLLEDVDEKDTKIIRAKLNSMRLDTLLKAGLGIAKNKVEVAFYESRIRVNGEKVSKKSIRIKMGDEVDVIKGVNSRNPAFLDVSRVNVVAADVDESQEKIIVILKRYKSLTIENYKDPYRRGAISD